MKSSIVIDIVLLVAVCTLHATAAARPTAELQPHLPSSSTDGYALPPDDIERLSPRNPVYTGTWRFKLVMGGSYGGSQIPPEGLGSTFAAGAGLTFALGTALTPLRWQRHGLGLGAEIAIKGWDADEGAVRFIRYPLFFSAHYLYRLGSGVRLFVATGPQVELAPSLSGPVRSELRPSTGWVGEVGVLLEGQTFGGDVSLRYTAIRYVAPSWDRSLDGSSLGLFLSLHIIPISTVVRDGY